MGFSGETRNGLQWRDELSEGLWYKYPSLVYFFTGGHNFYNEAVKTITWLQHKVEISNECCVKNNHPPLASFFFLFLFLYWR